MVSALRLTPLSQLESCGSSTVYSNAQQTLTLKQYMLFTEHTPRERETCVLQALQQFSWAPRWFCTGTDYVLSSYSGRPACREYAPQDYIVQIGAILSDLHSVGVRHNDLHKHNQTDFLVDERTGRMSLTDYGWSSMHGSLNMTCAAHDDRVLVATQSRPRSKELDAGVAAVEAPESVTIPSCRGLYAAKRTQAHPMAGGFIKSYTSIQECKAMYRPSGAPKQFHKFMQPKRAGAGSQTEVPFLQHLESALHIGGYQSFDVALNGSVTYTTQTSKYDRIQGVLARILQETGSRTLADVGCNNGLVSFLAHRLGFSEVYALDHDKPAIEIVRTVASERALPIHARDFEFGKTPIPQTDVVFVGALIHWVFCLTADFGGSFGRVLDYLTANARHALVIEWVDGTDGAIRKFHHIDKCAKPLEDEYTQAAFEAALTRIGTIERRVDVSQENQMRIIFVVKLRRARGLVDWTHSVAASSASASQGVGWRGLIVYSGPSTLEDTRFSVYASNIRFFLRHGVPSCSDRGSTTHMGAGRFDLVVSLSNETLSRFERDLRCAAQAATSCSSSVRVLLRENRCYDMETLRLLFVHAGDVLDGYDVLVYLNCGQLGPLLPLRGPPQLFPLAASSVAPKAVPFWALRFTRMLSARRKMVGLMINCGGKLGHLQAHVGSEGPWAVDREGLRILRQSRAIFDCTSTTKRDELIVRYELGMSGSILRAGHSIASRLRLDQTPTEVTPGFEFDQSQAFSKPFPEDCIDLWWAKKDLGVPADENIFWKVTHMNNATLSRLRRHSQVQDAQLASRCKAGKGNARLQFIKLQPAYSRGFIVLLLLCLGCLVALVMASRR